VIREQGRYDHRQADFSYGHLPDPSRTLGDKPKLESV